MVMVVLVPIVLMTVKVILLRRWLLGIEGVTIEVHLYILLRNHARDASNYAL